MLSRCARSSCRPAARRSASCRCFRLARFFLSFSIAPLPKTARQTDNSLALCLRLFDSRRRGGGPTQPWALS